MAPCFLDEIGNDMKFSGVLFNAVNVPELDNDSAKRPGIVVANRLQHAVGGLLHIGHLTGGEKERFAQESQRLEIMVHDLHIVGDKFVCVLVLLKVERPADIECQKKHEVRRQHFFHQERKIVTKVLAGIARDVKRDNQIVPVLPQVGAKVAADLSGRAEYQVSHSRSGSGRVAEFGARVRLDSGL